MSEGGLGAPVRRAIAWEEPDFTDGEKIDAEMRRVFDICHGCRRCFNLCDSFPTLFDLIDDSKSGELDTVASTEFKPVVDACTLCDMCFMTKCPYVPPHEFDLDFPHLMLRYRAAEFQSQKPPFMQRQLTETDRNGGIATRFAPLANWGSNRKNGAARVVLEKIADVHRDAELPKYQSPSLLQRSKVAAPEVNRNAPAFGRKAVIYATCFANFNNPEIGEAARAVLAHNGVETEIVYPGCCGMPQLEQGDLPRVAEQAQRIAKELVKWIERGYDVIALVPSCVLMLKFEWPLLSPSDDSIKTLSQATFDISEYVVAVSRENGLVGGLTPLDGAVTLHIACHARAQNIGQKGAEMMHLVPDTEISVIERCSGHGGSWGVLKENFEVALKVGKPVARDTSTAGNRYLVSECPLAGLHIAQGMENIGAVRDDFEAVPHPIVLFARAYGLVD
jgi:glycerol-3-phosphate dehydrogenase subunit C